MTEIFDWDTKPGPEVIKLFSCSPRLSMNFVLLINLKLLTTANSFLLNIAEHIFSAETSMKKSFITSGPELYMFFIVATTLASRSDKGITFWHRCWCCLFVCVEVLRPSQPNWVMLIAVSLPNHTFTGQALSSKRITSIVHILLPETDNCPSLISGRERITVENTS